MRRNSASPCETYVADAADRSHRRDLPRRAFTVAVLSIALLALAPRHVAAQDAPSAPPADLDVGALLAEPALGDTARNQLALFQLINQARADAGLYPLRLDARLMASAGEHAADMAAGRYCRHTGSDGSSSKQRIRRHGYPHNNWAGENILCSRRSPELAMRWWLGSGPHRRNLLHRHFTHIGIGYDPDGPYGPMWVLNFAAGASDTIVPTFAPARADAQPADAPGAGHSEPDDDGDTSS